ncbi:hypothetical protein HERIO_55 [Hepatospora eriocheir]|uniref:Uncharacterized protein n=1 Tax=Hepatospora eriocheir TaxID=1081669 RepID=A0A1X0QEH7_9MICR|nr:hypothetical protein HERIO_55 [Hepatospora eriocheir]
MILDYINKITSLLSEPKKNKNVVVQNDFIPYLHQIDNFFQLKCSKTKFFIENSFNFEETFKHGGVVSFTKEFVEYGCIEDMRQIAFIVKSKSNWNVILPNNLLALFKKRLDKMKLTSDENRKLRDLLELLNKVNFLPDLIDQNFISYVERSNIKIYRHFILIGKDNQVNVGMPLQQARSFLNKL